MDNIEKLSFNYDRRFGVEIEINSFDNRDFQLRPLNKEADELPLGIDRVANLVMLASGQPAVVKSYHHTHHNNTWVIKPDRSCGMEICSPVSKGWPGLKSICEVSDVLSKNHNILVDERCSLHLHVEVMDCDMPEIAKILSYWIKFEPIFMDSMPILRKRNTYCQCIGMTNLFEYNVDYSLFEIIKKLGDNKYYSANCHHFHRGDRKTLEFRIAENHACLDPFYIKNWIRLIVHFVERCKIHSSPFPCSAEDSWTGLSWLDLKDLMQFLGFTNNYELSKGMEQTRNWFMGRIANNLVQDFDSQEQVRGIWSEKGRAITKYQLFDLYDDFGLDFSEDYLTPKNIEFLYSNEYKI